MIGAMSMPHLIGEIGPQPRKKTQGIETCFIGELIGLLVHIV